MLRDPFTLFHPFGSDLTVALCRREDPIQSDGDAAQLLGLDPHRTAGLHQVHGNKTVILREPSARILEADGMLTDQAGLLLCTRWADCQNFAVSVPQSHVVGVLHAGWKGLVAGAIPSFFAALQNEWQATAADAFVVAGPSLCAACAEFTDPLSELPGIPSELINGRTADLQTWADQQLLDAGVLPQHFERHPACTRCSPDAYWTYRGGHREEVKNGRTNMLVIALRAN